PVSILDHFILSDVMAVRFPQDVVTTDGVAWSEPTVYPCWIEPTSRLMRLADGQQVAASSIVWLVAPGLPTDGLYFPGSDGSELHEGKEPLAVQEHKDLATGLYSHTQVWF